MCKKAVHNSSHALWFVPDFYKNQKMWSKAVNTYQSAIQNVPYCYKSQEMCNKAVDTYIFVFDFILHQYMT